MAVMTDSFKHFFLENPMIMKNCYFHNYLLILITVRILLYICEVSFVYMRGFFCIYARILFFSKHISGLHTNLRPQDTLLSETA